MSQLPRRAYRLDHLPPYGFAVLGQRIQDMTAVGKDVIRLDIGSPDLPPSEAVIEAFKRSASNPHHYQYGSYRGDPAFREAVAAYYKRRFGVELDPFHEILPLIGSKEGLVNLAVAYIDRGDAAIVPSIAYPAYMMGTIMAGGSVIDMPLDPDNGYLPDFDAIKGDLSHAKLLWINYPNNPTGAVADLAFYERAAAFCREHNLLLCSDNPYCEIVFDGYQAPSALQAAGAKDCTVEFMSVSKTYNLAGVRLGACVGNAEAIHNLLNVKSNIDSGHWKAIYDAATYAINNTSQSWIDERNLRYQARRRRILDTLPHIGLEAFESPATLYVWARVPDGDDESYARAALEEAEVALTPGTIYGIAGAGYVRISLTMPEERLDAALARLRDWYRVRVA
ncbi:MAG TPA: aminotransferase class I/II-fold pyridoxal phosphate-dependent enzyme [Aggregatilineales bacterium]|nr:aminotransferase class I/II-fold pyridoxal phosphate-dependent enzyme [Aggregatilineales bacterium]